MYLRLFVLFVSFIHMTCVMPIDLSPEVDLTVKIPQTPCSQIYVENHKTQIVNFPINLIINSKMSERNIETTLIAAARWNEAMGTAVFVPMISDTWLDRYYCGRVYVNSYPIKEPHHEYKGRLKTWVDKCSAEVRIEEKASLNTVLHGLGHALNLKHDLNSESIMFEIPGLKITDMNRCLVGLALKEFLIITDVKNGNIDTKK